MVFSEPFIVSDFRTRIILNFNDGKINYNSFLIYVMAQLELSKVGVY